MLLYGFLLSRNCNLVAEEGPYGRFLSQCGLYGDRKKLQKVDKGLTLRSKN